MTENTNIPQGEVSANTATAPAIAPETTTLEAVNKAVEAQEDQPKPKKVFSRNDVKKSIDFEIHFPAIDPDLEPFGFKFRLKLSREAEERRQKYVGLSAVKQTETATQQALDEVCDLLAELPTGFSDLKELPGGPGVSFRTYYETTEDPYAKEFLAMVIEAADLRYWGAITPREFRR